MSTDYTLHSKVSADALFETWRGLDETGKLALIRYAPDLKNGDILVRDGAIISQIIMKLKNPKHAAYFPHSRSWDNEKGYVTYVMDKSALSLTEVKKAFNGDMNLADSTWMINRLLEALHLSNGAGFVHCSVTPDNFFIIPETHKGKLLGFEWSGVEPNLNRSGTWSSFYPPEEPSPSEHADVYMASMVIGYLMPADPDDMPEALGNLLAACQLGPRARVQTIKELHDDFNKIIKATIGPRKFRPLVLP